MASSLLTGLLAIPAVAADAPPAEGPVADRVKAVAAWEDGGPAVRRAAAIALSGSDADVTAFVTSGRAAAAEQDLRAQLEELVAASGPTVREHAKAALAGSAADMQTFLDKKLKWAYEGDQRLALIQIMSTGGSAVKDAANKAMNGSLADVDKFLADGQYTAREGDDRLKLIQLMSVGGPEVKKAANTAMNGPVEDVRAFLRYGYQTAAAHDQETLDIAQLADLTKNAADQAGEQAKTAKDTAAQALDATNLAKQAAELAASETRAAQADASKATNAAGRAADAAERSAAAAEKASAAAKAANEAGRQAASAAANAASAAAKAGNAASRALDAASRAARDEAQAGKARDLALAAVKAVINAKSAAESSLWAEQAAQHAKEAAGSTKSASDNSAAAATASADAAAQSGVSDEAADRARKAAARARSAAAEAGRAATATVKIADEAAAAAHEARQAALSSAGHAEAAAAAAEDAARNAGHAANAAQIAQTAAEAADQASTTAANAAAQAHKVADIARAADQERLNAQQAAEVAAAQKAYREEELRKQQTTWAAGQKTELAADIERLLTEATATGVDQKVAVTKGRQVAVRLLEAGGPWVKAAAERALEGTDGSVLGFLSTDLALAREQDDRVSVMAIAESAQKLEQRLAAETASVGSAAQVREFLATGAYPGQEGDDRLLLTQIMSGGGPAVKDAANTAMNGSHTDVRAFLTKGQYTAREGDQRLLITQAIASGGPEVKAAAQAAMAGPSSGLEAFLQIGLPKARERDAVTAAHVATVDSYLAGIDANVAQAHQFAAQAAESYATARGLANEAATAAGRAAASAKEADDWAVVARAAADRASASADQAKGHAKQARTAAASADQAARSASASAAQATSSAQQARRYAAIAKDAADRAAASAAAAGKSRDEAEQAAREAKVIVARKQQAEAVTRQAVASGTVINNGDERAYYVEVVERPGFQKKTISDNLERCDHGTMGLTDRLVYGNGNWRKNEAGVLVCDVTTTALFTGTVDYLMRTCPEPGLTVEQCKGKYSVWDTIVLSSTTLDRKTVTATIVMTREQFFASGAAPVCFLEVCYSGAGAGFLANVLYGDAIECINHPGITEACGFAAATLLPAAIVLKSAKAVAAFRAATATGIGVAEATAALDAALGATNQALVKSLTATAGLVTKFRLALKDGVGTEDALKVLRNDPNISPSLLGQLDGEGRLATALRSCPTQVPNSFPAGTLVLLGDGTSRSIEALRVGDQVTATDPVTGITGPRTITDTIRTPDDRDFTELTIQGVDGPLSAVTATDHHPFWVQSTRAWTDAAAVKPGDTLRTDTGATVQVASIRHWTGLEPAYNLTVDGLHTYYVLAGDTPLLVHNITPAEEACRILAILAKMRVRPEDKGATQGWASVRQTDGTLKLEPSSVDSGDWKSAEVKEISDFLRKPETGLPQFPSAMTTYPTAEHAEVKIAWDAAKRRDEVKEIEIVINNRDGDCTWARPGVGCAFSIPKILYTGQTAIIRWVDKEGVLQKTEIIKGTREK
ncbi:polymorphic toxin-type HINT domain-containing protein [Kitasatospora sp. NPDC098663]|uniref:polymorphic toxin-type HINT domain-containing protein n=1 Tax=Kitasatospora sp. NPDC098663 TaxID=3364096 RepID=UPI003806AC4D